MPDIEPLAPGQLAAYFALMEVGDLLQHAVDRQLREEGGLSYIQFQILAVLAETAGGQQRITDIADRLVHSRSGLTYQVTQLTQRGLVARTPSPDDERSVIVSLTPEGRSLLERVLTGHVEIVRRDFLAAIGEDDLARLTDILGRVRTHMRAAPPRSAAPRRRRDPPSGRG